MKKLMTIIFLSINFISFSRGINLGPVINILNKMYGTQISSNFEEINQTKNQLEQIKNDAINMATLDQALSMGQLNQLQQGIQSIINIQNKSKSQLNDYKNFQNQFKNLYTDYKDMKNLTSDDYLEKTNILLQETKNVMEDSTRILEIGDVNKLSNDSQRIKAIMSVANSAEGQKKVAQAAAQLSSMQIQILAEQRTLMASSLKSQNSYILKKIQEEEIIKAESDKLKRKTIDVSREKSNVLKGWKK